MKIFVGLLASSLAAPAPTLIGGKDAKDGDFPWQATISRSDGSHICNGSIIASKKVI